MNTLKEMIRELAKWQHLMRPPVYRRYEACASKVAQGIIPSVPDQNYLAGLLRVMRSEHRERWLAGDLAEVREQLRAGFIEKWG